MKLLYILVVCVIFVGSAKATGRTIQCARSSGQYIPVFSDGRSHELNGNQDDNVMHVMRALTTKVDIVNARLGRIFTQCTKNTRRTRKEEIVDTARHRAASVDCEIEENGLCYWLVTSASRNITMLNAWETCASRAGGRPASVETADHYSNVVKLLRSKIRRPRFYSYVWLGLQIDQMTKTVSTADGSVAKFVKWYAKMYPISHSKFTQIYLYADQTRSSGFMNYDPMRPTNGVLCETMV